MTVAIVAGQITLCDLQPKTFERIRLAFSLKNPEYENKKRFGANVDDTPEEIDIARETPEGFLQVPRGAWKRVKELAAKDDVTFEGFDKRTLGEPLNIVSKDKLRPYQQRAVDLFVEHTRGVIVLPCGGGKTRLGLGIVARVARTTLVVVPNDDLLDQWKADCLELLGVTPGVLNASHKEIDADIVIATPRSALNWLAAHPEWPERFGLVIIDEAHLVASDTYTALLTKMPAKWRLGLTATPYREDGLGALIEWTCGPILLECTVDELAKQGFLIKPKIVFVNSPAKLFYDPNDKRQLQKILYQITKELIASVERNAFLVNLIMEEVNKGEVVMVLANSIPLCNTLFECLQSLDVSCEVLTGKVGKKKRKAHVSAMREGTLHCILATSLADIGLNLPRMSRIVLAFPESARGRTVQRVGRLMRPFGDKKPQLIDVVDNHPTLRRRAAGRRRTYKQLGLIVLRSKKGRHMQSNDRDDETRDAGPIIKVVGFKSSRHTENEERAFWKKTHARRDKNKRARRSRIRGR